MTNLVYLSPLPWTSFAQRPHKFVDWFRDQSGGQVLWVDPYPTRLPKLRDVGRLLSKNPGIVEDDDVFSEAGVTVVRPRALPIEPLPFSGYVNRLLWAGMLKTVQSFAERDDTWLAIGKPSQLATLLMRDGRFTHSIYDCMDHFAAFYSGVSRLVMEKRERELAEEAEFVLASSTSLRARWCNRSSNIALVRNACDPDVLPAPVGAYRLGERPVFGYVGTIGSWFDWDAVVALAGSNTDAIIRLIGPMFSAAPRGLPANVELLPPCSHEEAMKAVKQFHVGLIPFKRNVLTESVDPIKYYEYRAMGLPVLSTRFGEMRYRERAPGVFLADTPNEQRTASQLALAHVDTDATVQAFRQQESWVRRFNDCLLLAMLTSVAAVN